MAITANQWLKLSPVIPGPQIYYVLARTLVFGCQNFDPRS